LFSNPHRILEGNVLDAGFGNSVSSAGDVNADGYSDIIIGASNLSNGERREGRAYVYFGSPAGIPADPAWTRESNQANADLGITVKSAGDFNGDGFADVIVAADLMDGQGAEDQGRVEFYSGSGLTAGLDFAPLQIGTQFHTPIALRGSTFNRSSFAITANGNPQADGASVVWMEWEVKPLNVPFDSNDIQQTAAMPIGSRLRAVVNGLQFNTQYRWRARIASDHPTSPESVWFSIPGSNLTEAKIRGPRVSTLEQNR
jgi:hypothetical protein